MVPAKAGLPGFSGTVGFGQRLWYDGRRPSQETACRSLHLRQRGV